MCDLHKLVISLFLVITMASTQAQNKTIEIPGASEQIDLVKVSAGKMTLHNGIDIPVLPFYIGKYEVTWDQFSIFQDIDKDKGESYHQKIEYDVDAIARPTPPYEDFSKGMGQKGGYPMVSVTQQGALAFCKWLYLKTGVFFRLPTETEWQYACQQGRSDAVDTDEVAYYYENSHEVFHKTGEKTPNAIGVYDMLGNVAEWTADGWTDNLHDSGNPGNWQIPDSRYLRVVKGGSYLSDAKECNCTYREKSSPRWQMRDPQIPKSIWWNTDAPFVGFRVVVPDHDYTHEQIMDYYDKAIVK